jgi:uncharacterized OsmC-like protein
MLDPTIGDPNEDVSLRPELHPRYNRPMTMAADCVVADHQLKKVVSTYRLWNPDAPVFEFWSEEGPSLGGQGRYPLPLMYVLGGVGTCLLTQLIRYASMLKKTITHAEVRVEMDWFVRGSVLAETVDAGATECRTHFRIESPESDEDIARIVRLAKRGCFAERMVATAVPVRSTFEVNGQPMECPLDVDA